MANFFKDYQAKLKKKKKWKIYKKINALNTIKDKLSIFKHHYGVTKTNIKNTLRII